MSLLVPSLTLSLLINAMENLAGISEPQVPHLEQKRSIKSLFLSVLSGVSRNNTIETKYGFNDSFSFKRLPLAPKYEEFTHRE